MQLKENNKETLIKPSENSISDFFLAFKENYTTFNNKNLILDFSDFKGVKTENILVFLQLAKDHRNNGMSFVIVSNEVNPDALPDELIAVPTISEAKDIIEMEEIERDLGF